MRKPRAGTEDTEGTLGSWLYPAGPESKEIQPMAALSREGSSSAFHLRTETEMQTDTEGVHSRERQEEKPQIRRRGQGQERGREQGGPGVRKDTQRSVVLQAEA